MPHRGLDVAMARQGMSCTEVDSWKAGERSVSVSVAQYEATILTSTLTLQ